MSVESSAIPRPRVARERPLRLRIHSWLRWLHIYISMFTLLVVLFFAVTGITLNHAAQIPAEPVTVGGPSRLDRDALRGLYARYGFKQALREGGHANTEAHFSRERARAALREFLRELPPRNAP